MSTELVVSEELRGELATIEEYVAGLKPYIRSDAELQDTGLILRDVRTRIKDLEARRMDRTRPLDESKRLIMADYAIPIGLYKGADERITAEVGRYQREQASIRAEAERKLREEADKARRAAEAREAELRAKADAEEDQAKADRLRAYADAQAAKAESIIAPTLAGPAKVAGISSTERWSAEVTDLKALLQGVIDGRIPAEAVEPNMPYLNQVARALKGSLNYPGVRAVSESGIAARRI